MRILITGGSGFIGSYLMAKLPWADNIDLKDGKNLCNGISTKNQYDVIIHLACNQENTKEAYEENWKMYEAIEQYMENFPSTYYIYISSAAVYNLNSWYALSKQLGEAYAQRLEQYAILRLSNVYGHGDGHGAPDRFMRGENTINGDGEQIRDLIPVELVVTRILKCKANRRIGIFNVSSGVGTSVNQMFKLFGKGLANIGDEKLVGVKESILTPGEVDG